MTKAAAHRTRHSVLAAAMAAVGHAMLAGCAPDQSADGKPATSAHVRQALQSTPDEAARRLAQLCADELQPVSDVRGEIFKAFDQGPSFRDQFGESPRLELGAEGYRIHNLFLQIPDLDALRAEIVFDGLGILPGACEHAEEGAYFVGRIESIRILQMDRL